MRRLAPLLLLSSIAGCDPFANMPGDGALYLSEPLWDPAGAAAIDGLYVRLPRANKLVRVKDTGAYDVVDLGGRTPLSLIETPSREQVLVFGRWPVCEDPDPKIEFVSDCPDEDLVYESELAIVEDGRRTGAFTIPAHMNALTFSPDGENAVAYLDFNSEIEIEIDGIVDLTEVVFLPLDGGDPVSVSIGFSPSNILFTDDGGKAVIMSRSKVVVVDLDAFEVQVEYPLTLDADQEVDPRDAVLTPDGNTALVSVVDSSLLYKLDLQSFSIDIEDLDAAPADLAVSATADETFIAYGSLARVDVLRHADYELDDPFELDDPVNGVLVTDNHAVLYNDQSTVYDVYTVDLETNALTEMRVANPVSSMQLSPGGQYLVALLRPENNTGSGLDAYQDRNWGLGVADLNGDELVSLVLESEPVGLELVEGSTTTYALLLLDGLDEVLQVDLANPSQPAFIELPGAPTGIGALPDGRFWISHNAGNGLISFLDPESGDLSSTGGFALPGLLDDDRLPAVGNGGDQ